MKERQGLTHRGFTRRGFTLIELLVVVLIISILAAIAQPRLSGLIVRARATDAIADMRVVQMAVFNYEVDQKAWPAEVAAGVVPPGLPEDFSLVKEDYSLDIENWGGSPFFVGVTLVTSDTILGITALDMMAPPKWSSGSKYTLVFQ